MKKFLILLLSTMLLMSLSGCSETDGTVSPESEKNKPDIPVKNEPKIVYAIKSEGDEEIYDMAVSILRYELDWLGFFDADIHKNKENNIEIVFPGDPIDINEIANSLLTTHELTFTDFENNVILNGKTDIEKAESAYGPITAAENKEYYIELTLTDEGQAKFAEATEKVAEMPEEKNIIKILFDDYELSEPRVNERIDSKKCVITGNFTEQAAKTLTEQINFTLEPVELEIIEISN